MYISMNKHLDAIVYNTLFISLIQIAVDALFASPAPPCLYPSPRVDPRTRETLGRADSHSFICRGMLSKESI